MIFHCDVCRQIYPKHGSIEHSILGTHQYAAKLELCHLCYTRITNYIMEIKKCHTDGVITDTEKKDFIEKLSGGIIGQSSNG